MQFDLKGKKRPKKNKSGALLSTTIQTTSSIFHKNGCKSGIFHRLVPKCTFWVFFYADSHCTHQQSSRVCRDPPTQQVISSGYYPAWPSIHPKNAVTGSTCALVIDLQRIGPHTKWYYRINRRTPNCPRDDQAFVFKRRHFRRSMGSKSDFHRS